MARKSIKGYAEKNYYDNTRFSGGIVATNDPLNEGYFKHMVNFDISDTGASVEPRKGFFTTTFKIKDVVYNGSGETMDVIFTTSNKTIYFYDASLGKHIFIDFSQDGYKEYDDNDEVTYSCILIISADFDIDKKYLTNAELITKFDWDKLKTDLNIAKYTDISFLQDKAELAIDEYGISRYIIKAEYTVDDKVTPIWVSFVYRKNGSTYEGITYEADTLVMEYLDFSDTVSINMADRNLASGMSIIPDPIQVKYPSDDLPLDFIQQFPLIYAKDSEGKYLINTTKKLDGLELLPYFQLEEAREGYNWYYTYDIISTDPGAGLLDSENKFESGIFELTTGKSVTEYLLEDKLNTDSSWLHTYKKLTEKEGYYNGDTFNEEWNNLDIENSIPLDTYKIQYFNYLNSLNVINTKDYLKNNRATIIYIFPKQYVSNIYEISHIGQFNALFDNTYTSSDLDDSGDGYYWGDFIFKYGGHYLDEYYFNDIFRYDFEIRDKLSFIQGCKNLDEFIISIQTYLNTSEYLFFVCHTDDMIDYNKASSEGLHHITQTALNSRICFFKEDEVLNFSGLKSVLKDNKDQHIVIKAFTNTMYLSITNSCFPLFTDDIIKMLPNFIQDSVDTNNEDNEDNEIVSLNYFMCSDLERKEFILQERMDPSWEPQWDKYISFINYRNYIIRNRLFKEYVDISYTYYFRESYEPLIQSTWRLGTDTNFYNYSDNLFSIIDETVLNTKNIFYNSDDIYLIGSPYNYKEGNELHKYLYNNKYFETGVSLILYLFQAPVLKYDSYFDRDYLITSTALKQSRQIILSTVEPTTIIEKLTEEPKLIANADNSLVFRSVQGDHLIVYNNNKVFISEAGMQYYFKYDKMFEYPETVVKVIQYKDTLLVFTTQNLYSIYPIEVTENVASGTDEEGNATYTQVTTIAYGNLPVLYNLLVNEKYKDAIQVYNQMVLFYSADGQMFMIKPTATIDSNTRFSIQYFNKNANDILLNYKYYMQERLKHYRYDDLTIDEVNIKVSVSLNYIKIFYCAPGIMTYILVYDIINNRYYAYDTLSFTNIRQLEFVPDGELYIVDYNNQLYFTQPYVIPNEVNSNVDRAFYNNFAAESIHSELDTGIINLNNHLKKRFRDLHIIYKNLDAQNIEFALDVFVDNVPIALAINTEIEIKNVGIIPTYNPSDIYSVTQLINKSKVELMPNNNALFDFSEFNSSKILTHKVSIISRGKHIRNKLCFKSEGKFKIQGYGLIYKEHTV